MDVIAAEKHLNIDPRSNWMCTGDEVNECDIVVAFGKRVYFLLQ